MPSAFSEILLIGILAVVLVGGFFAWQKFGAQRENIKAPEKFSKYFDDDDLLHKLFPNLEFKNGFALNSEYAG